MKPPPMPITDITARATFGQYKGRTFEDIGAQHPGYIVWINENIETMKLPDDFVDGCELDSEDQEEEFEDERWDWKND